MLGTKYLDDEDDDDVLIKEKVSLNYSIKNCKEDTILVNEKVSFDCSIKNYKKDTFYKIRILNEDKSLGEFPYLETEELNSEEYNEKISFKTLNGINYVFSQRQLFKIKIMIKTPGNNQYDNYERLTLLSSLVSSPGSLYERKVNENEKNSEIFSIYVKPENNIYLSELGEYSNSGVLNFFKEGGKLKLFFYFDFLNKDLGNDYLKSQNIFYNLLVNFYNYCHLYTESHEVYIFEKNEKLGYSETGSIISIYEGDFIEINVFNKIKEHFMNNLNKEHQEKQLNISPFIEKSMKEINNDNFIISIIFIRNFPEDITMILNKIKNSMIENAPIKFILINTGNKFSTDLSNQIEDFPNIILIEHRDESLDSLDNIVHTCLNKIATNISQFNPNQRDNKNNKKNLVYSSNFIGSINSFEGDKDDEVKNSLISSSNNSIINNHNININTNINNSSGNKNEVKKILKSSDNLIDNIENPFSKNVAFHKYNNNNSIKESENEEDSESNKIPKENNDSLNLMINNKEKKDRQKKVIDSNAKTDYNSYNNKIIK